MQFFLLVVAIANGMELDVESDPEFHMRHSGSMIIDDDEARSCHASSSSGPARPQGPQPSEIFKWAPQLVHQLLDSDVSQQYLTNLVSHATHGILVNTQYSGMGCAEMSMHMISKALTEVMGVSS